jgi:hypothetical protein
LGLHFQLHEVGYSSPGGFANGYYTRRDTRIGLVYRAGYGGLGCVIYEQEEFCQEGYLRERLVYGLGHSGYMRQIEHADDSVRG